jgi:hypothetical protein
MFVREIEERKKERDLFISLFFFFLFLKLVPQARHPPWRDRGGWHRSRLPSLNWDPKSRTGTLFSVWADTWRCGGAKGRPVACRAACRSLSVGQLMGAPNNAPHKGGSLQAQRRVVRLGAAPFGAGHAPWKP